MAEVQILHEQVVIAVEQLSTTANSRVFHVAWPSEFPLTVCGVIATEARGRTEPRAGRRGADCRACEEWAATNPLSRNNPHSR